MAKQWLQRNLTALVTGAALLFGGAATWGRMDAAAKQMDGKADRIAVTREMDLLHAELATINHKLDALLLRNKAAGGEP